MNIERFLNPALKNTYDDESVIIFETAEKMEEAGADIIHMDMGRPNFDTPKRIKDAAIRALEEGKVHYTSLNGIKELKDAIAKKENTTKNVNINSNDNVLVTVGASEALVNIWLNFLKPGDEVLIPTPCYCSYLYMLHSLDIKVVEVPLINNNGIEFNIEKFNEALSPRTKMIVLNTPNNPTGMVLNRKQLQDLSEFAIKNDLLVVSDECYDNYLFSGEHISIYTFPGMWERTITVNSVSKTYSMTGWRVGYAIASKEIIDIMALSHGNAILCATSFAQVGAAEAINNVKEEVSEMKKEFLRRRECVIQWMDKIKVLKYIKPEGAFYVFFDVSSLGISGLEFCLRLLREYKVTTMPGSIYGADFNNYVRLAYTCNYSELEEGMKRIEKFVKNNTCI